MRALSLCPLVLLAAVAPAFAQGSGADVILSDVQSTSNFGVVGAYRGYAIGSHTCNIGSGNLLWTNNGTPALAMNMYRLKGGTLEMIGAGWCKHACCAGATDGCGGGCNGIGSQQLGINCLDVYSSSFNGGQSRLGARSRINPYTGAFSALQSGTGFSVIDRRLQVATADLDPAQNAGALYFVEGVYVGSDDAQSQKWHNNATYKRVTVAANGNLTLTGAAFPRTPAIFAWRDHGLGAGQVDNRVRIAEVNVPNEGRFYVASKVTQLAPNSYKYEYALYNLNSDAAGGGLSVPITNFASASTFGYRGVRYHSGENVSNDPWISARTATTVEWNTPQTSAQNPAGPALYWGAMNTFSFVSDAAPRTGDVTVKLFKNFSPNAVVATGLEIPGAPCRVDVAQVGGTLGADGQLTIDDIVAFLQQFFANNLTVADVTNLGATAGPDGFLSADDVIFFLSQFFAGCS